VKPWSSIKATTPDWLREKKITPIVQYTQQRHPELANVPAVVDLAQNDEQRQIFALFASGASLGTSVVAPPLPAPVAAAVRKAFSDTMQDAPANGGHCCPRSGERHIRREEGHETADRVGRL
jgi:hypothetical protein